MVDVAVVGASGYAGAELVSLLARHPQVRLASLHAEASAGKRFEELYPGRGHLHRGAIESFEPGALHGRDVVFLAQPHGASARAAAALRGRVGRVIDLSGDLRLGDAASYRRWYGLEHPAPALLGQAAYGLPELFGEGLAAADLVACAGCYATVAQLAAAPALALGAGGNGGGPAGPAQVTVSAVSGTTGAGRRGEVDLSFSEVAGNLRAYRVGRHAHAPEIARGLERASGREVRVTFVPHLAPIPRGIFATVVVANPDGIGGRELLRAYRGFYGASPFVRVVDPEARLPQVSDVVGTNFCDLAPLVDETAGTIVVLGVIDNLVKGAAGQAVQVMNLACGLAETAGLSAAAKEGACDA